MEKKEKVHLTIRFLNSDRVYGARVTAWINEHLKLGAKKRDQTKNSYVKHVLVNALSNRRTESVTGFDIEWTMCSDMLKWWDLLGPAEKGKMKTPCFSRYINQLLKEYFGEEQ